MLEDRRRQEQEASGDEQMRGTGEESLAGSRKRQRLKEENLWSGTIEKVPTGNPERQGRRKKRS